MNNEILEELERKIPFIYELNDKLYAIGHYKVFDCFYSKAVAPDFKKIFYFYKANSGKSYKDSNKNQISGAMYNLALYSSDEVQEMDNDKHIISIENFFSNLTNNDEIMIEKQLDEFIYMFRTMGMADLYPSINYL